MPRIGEVEYDEAGFEHMRALHALYVAEEDPKRKAELLAEAETTHEFYRQFPGLKMHDADPATVLDPVAARRAREEGQAKVERGSDVDWQRRATLAVRAVALEKATFTADDIWQKVEKPREPRALGPIMLAAARGGVCETTGRSVQSQIPVHHQAPVREYRSLIYRGQS